MAMLETWVNDKLHDILGISDKYVAQYLISLASKSDSSPEYIDKIKATGTIDVDTNMVNFASELWNKIPRKAKSEKPARAKEREIQEVYKKNQAYTMLSDEDEDDDYQAPSKKVKLDKKKKNIRKKVEIEESSDSESQTETANADRESLIDSDEEMDKERLDDLRKRDEFSQRLKNKDMEKTRKVMSKSEKKVCIFI